MEKANLLENSVFYINQTYKPYKNNKVYYCNYYILGQINQCQNPPEDLNNYVCKPDEIKIFRRKYDTVTGNFFGLLETLSYLTVQGD